MSRHLRTDARIEAPAEQVWRALVDVHGWDAWNPTLSKVRGELKVGSVVRMRLKAGPISLPMRQEILEVSEPTMLRWRSRFGPRWLMSVVRGFHIEPATAEASKLTQTEDSTGAFAGIVFFLAGRLFSQGHRDIAEALARRLEGRTGA